jgi:CDP-diacylglycerol--glycerol-3-phosphate 3-phosphatidyltransferase
MLIISREFIVTGLRLVAAGEGIVIAASKLGKLKTVLQDIAIVPALLNNSQSVDTDFICDYAAAAVIVTIYSSYDYIKKNHNVIKHQRITVCILQTQHEPRWAHVFLCLIVYKTLTGHFSSMAA